jgi:hypothetical protein
VIEPSREVIESAEATARTVRIVSRVGDAVTATSGGVSVADTARISRDLLGDVCGD